MSRVFQTAADFVLAAKAYGEKYGVQIDVGSLGRVIQTPPGRALVRKIAQEGYVDAQGQLHAVKQPYRVCHFPGKGNPHPPLLVQLGLVSPDELCRAWGKTRAEYDTAVASKRAAPATDAQAAGAPATETQTASTPPSGAPAPSAPEAAGTIKLQWAAGVATGEAEAPTLPAPPQPPTPVAPAQPVGVYEHKAPDGRVTGVEVVFPAKPAKVVLQYLRENGWRYHRKRLLWYRRSSEATLGLDKEYAQKVLTWALSLK